MKYTAILILLLALLPRSQPASLPVCSAATHNRYTAIGPDGATYATWHPQINARDGCVFDHEHGSDPALFDPAYKPLFGYSAAHHGMTEGHAGFKLYAFRREGYGWLILQHQGTSKADGAACTRHHTLDIAIRNDSGLVADIHTMADFGRAASNEVGNPALQTTCIDQEAIRTFYGVRQFPIAASKNSGYEPWRGSLRNNVIGLGVNDITFLTLDPQTACDTITCTTAIRRADVLGVPTRGTWRAITLYPGFGVTQTGAYSGTFTTNVMVSGSGDVQQFIAPGLNVRLQQGITLYPYNGQAYIYAPQTNLLDSVPFLKNPFVTGAN